MTIAMVVILITCRYYIVPMLKNNFKSNKQIELPIELSNKV